LIKNCEHYMWLVARRKGSKAMGKNAGTEFVDSIFGRDRELERTEKWMNSIRLWNMRFDANCEEILSRRMWDHCQFGSVHLEKGFDAVRNGGKRIFESEEGTEASSWRSFLKTLRRSRLIIWTRLASKDADSS